MSKGDTFENDLLKLIFQNTNIANVGDATGLRASTTAGSLYVALHTASPADTGSQTTNEATYSAYARVAVARSTAGWTVTTNTADNTAAITFPQATGGTNTITHFTVGTSSTGAGKVLYWGTVTPNLAVSNGITPEFAIGDLDITED